MKPISADLKKEIHLFFMKITVPRILADREKPEIKKEA